MRKNVGLLVGGKSTEHEVSLMSSKNVLLNVDTAKYDPYIIYITKNGGWYLIDRNELLEDKIQVQEDKKLNLLLNEHSFEFQLEQKKDKLELDVIFPVLHGPNGEDGSIQGLLEVANIPYVGPDILGSSVAMDKDLAKKLFEKANIPTAAYFCFQNPLPGNFNPDKIIAKLGLPLVVKPANAGSSVGISKVEEKAGFDKAVQLAFKYDTKIIIEEYIKGREIEVAVLGNEDVQASVPGEIVTEFYSYSEKYSAESKTRLDAPATDLSEDTIKTLRETAVKAFKALACEGMSRVDFFLKEGELYINEINTIPGFTNISMYPKLFEVSGIPQKELISNLIELAFKRHNRKADIKSNFEEL